MLRTFPEPLRSRREVILSARGLTKSFARGLARAATRTLALDDVDLDLGAGEILAVVGPEGSGKTTLLQCLCGLLKRDRGSIQLSGAEVAQLGPVKAIAYVPAAPVYYPFLTVTDALELRAARGPGACRNAEIVERVLAAGGLESRRSSRVCALSRCEVRQLALAEAMMSRPAVILVDSRTHERDADENAVICGTLAACQAAGQSVLIASRDGSAVSSFASRIMFMNEGRLEQSFAAESRPVTGRETAPSPAALFVAERVH